LKSFEDKAWDDMLKRLNDELPQRSNRGIFYWMPAAAAVIGLLLGGYLLFEYFLIRPADNSFVVADKKEEMKVPHSQTDIISDPKVINTSDISDYKQAAVLPDMLHDKNHLSDEDNPFVEYSSVAYSNEENNLKENDLLIAEVGLNKKQGFKINNTESDISLSEIDKTLPLNNLADNHENDGESVVIKSRLISSLPEIEGLTMTDLDHPVSKVEPINYDISAPGHKWLYAIGIGSFSEIAYRYSGLQVIPQAAFSLGRKDKLFLKIPISVRYTHDNNIVQSANEQANAIFDRQSLFVPDNIEIESNKVNPFTVDLGLEGGYSLKLGKKLSASLAGILRYDNIGGLIQAFSRVKDFAYSSNVAYQNISKTYSTKNDGWNYGANIGIKYDISPRHGLYASVGAMHDDKNYLEASLGYSYRLY